MVKGFPPHGLLAEPLHWLVSSSIPVVVQTTHSRNFIKIIHRVPQNLDCDLAALVFAHPHVREPTTVPRETRSIIAKRDLQ